MQFLAIQLTISLLLSLQLSTILSCDIANWWISLDSPGWSVCPRNNTYIAGFYRTGPMGNNGVNFLEEAKCCEAGQGYTNQPALCLNADWTATLDGFYVWAKCPTGYYLDGIRIAGEKHLRDIDEGKCCRPQNHPDAYETCYEEDVAFSFDKKGWSECNLTGYYMTGFYKGDCEQLHCIEKFYCCKMKTASVNGGWSVWGDWGKCSSSCRSGVKERIRTCTNPPPAYGGAQCSGSDKETQQCNIYSVPCLVPSGWSVWGDWGKCNSSCGGGVKERMRTCTSPPLPYGGTQCSGPDKETQQCNSVPCPVPGGWSVWGDWGKCSSSCSDGVKERMRTCTSPLPADGGAQCSGPEKEIQQCNSVPCPEISCYKCSSNTSFDECTKKQATVACPMPMIHCAKMENKITTKEGKVLTTYYKGCARRDQCNQSSLHTSLDCCSVDRCNTNSGPRCYECAGNVSYEECLDRRCIFNDGQCYYAWNQQGPGIQNRFKYGCSKQPFCNKTVDGYFIQCCEGNLCNEVNRPTEPTAKNKNLHQQTTPKDATSIGMVAYILFGVAFVLLLLFTFGIGFWYYRRSRYKRIERSASPLRRIIPLDKWEILPDQIEYEEELGRGAFGVVHRGTLRKRVGIKVFATEKQTLHDSSEEALQVVAVKVLKDDPTDAQKEEFMFEIEQMKLLGSHQNIVSMVGCCTLQEQKLFLVIEYVPFGDLLKWLRRKRKMINKNEAFEEKRYEDKNVFNHRADAREFDHESKVDQKQVEKDETQVDIELNPLLDHSNVRQDVALTSENLLEEKDAAKRKIERNHELSAETIPVNVVFSPPDDHRNVVLEMDLLPSVKNDEKELLTIPSTSQKSSRNAIRLLENLEEDDLIEEECFSTQRLFSFAWQIAKGMNHLAGKDFVHRDLAARNVLVGRDDQVKVSDFGLIRQIYEDVYKSEKTKKLPVKWMAPESLYQGVFTTKSDVWAYGVLLWEMTTLGGVPYPLLTNTELYKLLKTGYRMERPDMCCDEVNELMTECWREDPSTRPSFSQLIEKLEVIMQKDVPYCDLGKHDETSPYYNVPPGASAADESN